MSLKRKLAEELHRPKRRRFKTARVLIKGVLDDLWQADLVDLSMYPDRGYKYILTVIDAGSKKGWAEPLHNKSGLEVSQALKRVLDSTGGYIPRYLQTDKGTEFYNTHTKALLHKYGITLYSTQGKAWIVERWNRTLKDMMFLEFSVQGNYKWVDILPALLNRYNNRYHRSIGMKPADVTKRDERQILQRLFPTPVKVRKPRFKVGDRVRISKLKHVFAKSYLPNWTNEQFIITRVRGGEVPTYYLKDVYNKPVIGRFYEEEMTSTAFPDQYLVEKIVARRGGKVRVRWLGFGPEHDTWEEEGNVE